MSLRECGHPNANTIRISTSTESVLATNYFSTSSDRGWRGKVNAWPVMFLPRSTSAPHGPDYPFDPLHNGAPRSAEQLAFVFQGWREELRSLVNCSVYDDPSAFEAGLARCDEAKGVRIQLMFCREYSGGESVGRVVVGHGNGSL